jgi:hypothetical protein
MTLVGTSTECSFVLTADGFNQASIKYLTTNNTVEYTPTGDYHPATKKYVDDAVAANAGPSVVMLSQAQYDALGNNIAPGTLYIIN